MKKVLLTAILAGATIFAANAGNLTIGLPGFYLNIGDGYYGTPVQVVPTWHAPVRIVTPPPVRYRRPVLPPPRHHKPAPRHHKPAHRGHRR